MSEEKKYTFDLLSMFIKWRKLYYAVVGFGTLLATLIVFLIPNEYITFASVRGSSSGVNMTKLMQSSGALAGLGALADFAVGAGGGEIDYLAAILSSKTVQDSMIERFNLRKRYSLTKIEDVREKLRDNTIINKNIQSEIISFGVYDEDPFIAMQMTQYYLILLNQIYTSLNEQAAKNNREHLEKRYHETLKELSDYEDSLKTFQRKYGVYEIKTQTEAAIKAAASLKSEAMIKEVELGMKRKMYAESSQEIKRLEEEISQLKSKMDEMFTGEGAENNRTLFLPFHQSPEIGLAYIRLYRNVQIYNELVKVLVPLLEQARLQEKRESPSLVVLDHPTLPEKKAKPKRMFILIFIFFGLIFVATMIVLLEEYLIYIERYFPERYKRLSNIYDTLRGDVYSFFGKK